MLTRVEHLEADGTLGRERETIANRLAVFTSDQLVDEIEARRRGFVYPLFVATFVLFCLTLLVLAYLPDIVGYRVEGAINVAYLLALAQFTVT
ncbi:DUF485 domain-containing protein, partial [Beijerinckia sp. L45]|uniref:DUF485 domain-containing protein n=1 Tax=Beijerinckia sp. L45 TaxID=1641855 RepID=UPI00131E0E17